MASSAQAGTIWFWAETGAAPTTSLIWDSRLMRTLITMALTVIHTLGA